jgi:DNA-3-methyladenine glycosylase
MNIVSKDFFLRTDVNIAKDLLGSTLHFYGKEVHIIETEYYNQDEAGCHAFLGKQTKRNSVMFESGGLAYVYLIYGMHHCFNIVFGEQDFACSVLIRGILDVTTKDKIIGCGKTCKHLGITLANNRESLLHNNNFYITSLSPPTENYYITKPRVGLKHGADLLLRYVKI